MMTELKNKHCNTTNETVKLRFIVNDVFMPEKSVYPKRRTYFLKYNYTSSVVGPRGY